ncbi:MAG: isoprenyl transferase [Cellulosilyticaceae bacterium]
MEERNIPRHIAIIMDGNGRWAKNRGASRNKGHEKGANVLKEITNYADKIGIEYATVYAFSTENWRRPKEEVEGIMNLLRRYINNHIKNSKKDNIKVRIIGDRERLEKDIQEKIDILEDITKNKTGLCLNIAINYGGRDEIVRAIKKVAQDVASGKLLESEIDESSFENYLDTGNTPDPDLLIRTSGELRTSNFLPWQIAYSELYFADCLWPDFTKKEFDKALEDYAQRKRRFGKSE